MKEKRLEYDLLMTEKERAKQRAEQRAERERLEGQEKNYTRFLNIDLRDVAGRNPIDISFIYNNAKLIVIILLIVAALFASRYYNDKKPLDGTLSELHYRRDKYIMQYDPSSGEAWWDQIPDLAYDSVYSSQKVRTYRTEYYRSVCTRTKTTLDSKGNLKTSSDEPYSCQKSRQVPVYDDWWTFTINQWHVIKTITSEERQSKSEYSLLAKWPIPDGLVRELGTKSCGTSKVETGKLLQKYDRALGCQTVSGDQSEWYYASHVFKINGKDKVIECPVDYGTWQTLRVAMPMYGEYYTHNEEVYCADLHIGARPITTAKG